MKKLLLVIVCIFMLTGCDIEYNLTIDNDSFDEKIVLSILKQDTSFENMTDYLKNKIPISNERYETKFYEPSIDVHENSYDLVYDYSYDLDSFKNGFFVNNCYTDINITEDGDILNISSGKDFRCLSPDNGLIADSAKINIKTKLEVLDNNADSVNGDTYTWNINRNNYETKTINLKLKKVNENNFDFSFIIYIAIPIIIFGVIFVLAKNRIRKINKI